MLVHNPPCDGETESRPAGITIASWIGPVKAIEYLREIVRRNPDARIMDGDERACWLARQAERDAATRWCVLDGVVEQDKQQFFEAIGIARDDGRLQLPDLEPLSVSQVTRVAQGFEQHPIQFHTYGTQWQAGIGPRQHQEIADQAG